MEMIVSDRALASVRRISNISSIPNADAIQVAKIDGWDVVVKKDEFNIGDLVIYFEIDSWIPTELAPFLSKGKEPRDYNGVKGERLRTIRLRGQLSQGLVLPLNVAVTGEVDNLPFPVEEGANLTQFLGIQKWEPPISVSMMGQAKGNFPSHTPKTDAERVQNLGRTLENWYAEGIEWEVTEKIHGTSMTVYFDGETTGVCSRNYDLKLTQEGNTYVDFAKSSGILSALENLGQKLSIQGELAGGNIQNNAHYHQQLKYYIFNIWNQEEQRYLSPSERKDIFQKLEGVTSIELAPMEYNNYKLPTADASQLLLMADGESKINKNYFREGFVWKSVDGKHMFKTVSNVWLEKYD